MADGTDLELSVGAVADKASAEKTGKDLSKVILSNIGKDGHVEIPVEFKAPIKGASKELEKAQEDVIKQWEKTFKEGFSSSAKDLNDLTNAYQKFKRLASKEHKGNTKQSRGLTNIMGEPIQEYTTKRNTRRTEYNKALNKTKTQNKNKKTSYISDEEINANIKQEKARRTKGIESISRRLDYRKNAGIDPGKTNDDAFKLSESSPYGSGWATSMAKHLEEMADHIRTSLEVKIDKDEANKVYAPDSRKTSEYTVSKDEAKDAFKQIATVLGQLEKGRKDITVETLTNQVVEAVDKGLKSGLDLETIYNKLADSLQSRYSDSPMRKLGSTDGSEKGVGKNHDEAIVAQKEILKTLNKIWDSLPSYITMAKRFYQDGEKIVTNSSVINGSKQITDAMNEAFRPLRDIYNSSEKSIRYDKIENDRAGVADDAEAKTNKDILAVSKNTSSTVEDDATTGFNADSKADELIKNMTGKKKTTAIDKTEKEIPEDTISFNKQIGDALKQIIAILEVIKDGLSSGLTINTNTNTGKQSVKETEPEDNIWKQIADAVDRSFQLALPDPTPTLLNSELPAVRFEDQFKTLIKAFTVMRKSLEKPELQTPSVIRMGTGQLALPEHGTPDNYLSEEDIQKAISHIKLPEIEVKGDTFLDKLKKVFSNGEADRYLKMNQSQQDAFNAERIRRYGLNNSSISGTNTGDFAGMERRRNFWRNRDNKGRLNMFEDVDLGKGLNELNIDKLTEKLNKSIQSNMFKSQTGGVLGNLIGPPTLYLGQPSLEKRNSQTEGLNQVMADIRKAFLTTLEDIRTKESTLRGLQATGDANIDDQGNFLGGSEEAKKIYAEYEELKIVLKSIIADVENANGVINKAGGNVSKIIKQLSFGSQSLQKDNVILKNLNAGLNKNGKALKYQSRTAEILNYTFKLMARSVGQTLKSWLSMLNPLKWIKTAFSDFTSYSTKWQRTMNVIKYNLREIIRPFMEWIAQKLINVIGFLDIISMKIQEALGYTPISLFDQQNAQDYKDEIEEIYNVAAGFDEFHDISSESSSTGADDLLGEIYTPTLSQEWIDLANDIGDLFAGLITGDLGFSEACAKIWDLVKNLWNNIIWPFLRDKVWPTISSAFESLLGTLLKIFLAWKGLKLIGSLLSSAITSGLGSAILSGLKSGLSGIGTFLSSYNGLWTVGSTASTGTKILGTIGSAILETDGLQRSSYGAYNLGNYWDDLSTGEKVTNGLNTALGVLETTMAGFFVLGVPGAIMGFISGAGAALLGWNTENADGILSTEEATEKYNDALERQEKATDSLTEAEEEYHNASETLDYLQSNLGISGKDLALAVDQGRLSYDSMTDAQKLVYDAYMLTLDAQNKLTVAQQESVEADREVQDSNFETLLTNAKVSGSYEELKEALEEAYESGEINSKEYANYLSRAMAECDEDTRTYLLDGVAESVKESINYKNYQSWVVKFKEWWSKLWNWVKETAGNILTGIGEFFQRIGNVLSGNGWVTDTEKAAKTTMEVYTDDFEQVLTDLNYSKSDINSMYSNLGSAADMAEMLESVLEDVNSQNDYYTDIFGGETAAREYGYITDTSALESLIDKLKNVVSYDIGTNYVPSNGLAFLHEGEAVIPKKYNSGYNAEMSAEERLYMKQMMSTIDALNSTIKQGITVNGQFTQKGSDLVAVVNKVNARKGSTVLSNTAYAR